MKFDKSIYKKKYFLQAVKDVKKDYNIDVEYTETESVFEILDKEIAMKVADYYIYIYNENK